jgi:hypothetical protein
MRAGAWVSLRRGVEDAKPEPPKCDLKEKGAGAAAPTPLLTPPPRDDGAVVMGSLRYTLRPATAWKMNSTTMAPAVATSML